MVGSEYVIYTIISLSVQGKCREKIKHIEHFKLTIFHVNDINHNRPEKKTKKSRTMERTRKIQAGNEGDNMIIKTRNLICFCLNVCNEIIKHVTIKNMCARCGTLNI